MTSRQIFNTTLKRRPRVLIVPLDWGLGHASRCIPIISHAISIGCEVIIGAEGQQKALLSQEFPELRIIELSGYGLKYGQSSWHTKLKIFSQSLKILTGIKRENKWLDNFLETEHIDIVISDNRYGLYSKLVLSVFITHQLDIKSGMGQLMDKLIRGWNYRFIEKFSACWVPDEEGENSLAGELSHPKKLPSIPVHYIGWLSRFNKWLPDENNDQLNKESLPKKTRLLIVLSGPEPQRSLFENILLSELKVYQEPVVLIRGLPGEKNSLPAFNQVSIYNHLSSRQMYEKIIEAEIIISRSGYSSVMDMLMMGKKCVFVATPGQAEQEYLSGFLAKKRLCVAVEQHIFSLLPSLEKANQLPVFKLRNGHNQYQSVINKLMNEMDSVNRPA